MDWLLTRETVITLAVLGALASTLASLFQARGWLVERRVKQLNWLGYGFMFASMALFIIIGWRIPTP